MPKTLLQINISSALSNLSREQTVALDVDGSEATFTRQAQSLFQELLKADAA